MAVCSYLAALLRGLRVWTGDLRHQGWLMSFITLGTWGTCSAGSYLADPISPIPSHCAAIAATSTVRVKQYSNQLPSVQKARCHLSCHISAPQNQKLRTCTLKPYFCSPHSVCNPWGSYYEPQEAGGEVWTRMGTADSHSESNADVPGSELLTQDDLSLLH